jgi:hypothetical protein
MVFVEGEVTLNDWETLRNICLDALKSSSHLVLNITKVGGYDYSFGVLVCLLRRTVQLMGKRLTVIGKQGESFVCVYDAALNSNTKRCSFTGGNGCCFWQGLLPGATARKRAGGWQTPVRSCL